MEIAADILTKFWKMTEKMDKERLATQRPMPGIDGFFDIPYTGEGEEEHLLDVYFPQGTTSKLPTIVDIHGGGWMYGNKELNKNYCYYLASRGFTIVNINYTLAPIATIDVQIRDIFAAFRWIDENADEFFIDKENIFLTGDSAGGHLASLATVIMSDRPDLELLYGVQKPGFEFKAIGLTCGAFNLDIILNNKIFVAKKYAEFILGKDFENSPYKKSVSMRDLLGGTDIPPVYLVSSAEDFIKSQSDAMARLLQKYNVPHLYRRMGRVKGKHLTHVFNILYPDWPESIDVNNEMTDFFKKHMS